MMTLGELAHWKYRVEILNAEVATWTRWARDSRNDARKTPGEFMAKLASDSEATLEASKWLLAEARFNVILGELGQR